MSSREAGVTNSADKNASLDEHLDGLRIAEGGRPVEKRPRRIKRAVLWPVSFLLLAGVVVAAWQFWPRTAAPVSVAPVVMRETGAASVLTGAGYLAAERMATLSARVLGRIVFLPVDVGDRVRAGDVIARLEDAEYRAREQRAQAELTATRSVLARLTAGSRPEEIRQAEARAAAEQASLAVAERNYRRSDELFRQGFFAAASWDTALGAFETAQARVREAQEALRLARIGPREEEIAEARARERAATAELELARTQIGYTVIKAPFDGTIIDRKAQVGDVLFPAEAELGLPGRLTQITARRGSAIVRLADMRELNVEVDLNESDIGKISIGQAAMVVPDTAPDRKYDARVTRIYPLADRQKKTIQVKLRVEKPDDALRPEGGARVTFYADAAKQEEPVLLVPKAAVQKRNGESEVFVLREDRVQRRAVVLGREEGNHIAVKSGLRRGERVIVKGAEELKDGDRVRVSAAER